MTNNQPPTPVPLASTSTTPVPPSPSRFLADLLRPPHANNASYLHTLAQASLNELCKTQIAINQMYAEARKKFVIARAWFDGLSAASAEIGYGDGGGGLGLELKGGEVEEVVCEKVSEARRVYEGALGELEMRRLEVLRVESDVAVLKGDVSILLFPAITSIVEFKVTPDDPKIDVHADASLLA